MTKPGSPQLLLNLSLKDSATFANFLAGPNAETVDCLRRLRGVPWEPGIYLWGERGTGRSHLLQAVCHAAGERGAAAIYLPMGTRFPPEALAGIEKVAMVCIDDIQAVAGQAQWETALLHLLENIHAISASWVVTGDQPPSGLGLEMAPLTSRLAGGPVFQLKPLGEAERLQALELRAARRGLTLPAEAGRYLVRRCGRDLNALFAALETVDRASLAAKRKPNVSFIRELLDGGKSD